MNRTIKFRAWNKRAKEMSLVTTWNNMTHPRDSEYSYVCAGGVLQIKDVEIMQYIGLKDKNEVEIYEGDIIEYGYNCRDGYIKEGVCVIENKLEWSCSCCDVIYGWKLPTAGNNIYKVIGNIYENKDLLNK